MCSHLPELGGSRRWNLTFAIIYLLFLAKWIWLAVMCSPLPLLNNSKSDTTFAMVFLCFLVIWGQWLVVMYSHLPGWHKAKGSSYLCNDLSSFLSNMTMTMVVMCSNLLLLKDNHSDPSFAMIYLLFLAIWQWLVVMCSHLPRLGGSRRCICIYFTFSGDYVLIPLSQVGPKHISSLM